MLKNLNTRFKYSQRGYVRQKLGFKHLKNEEPVKMPIKHGLKNRSFRLVTERVNTDDVKMAQKPLSDFISSASRWSHRTYHGHVNQVNDTGVLQVNQNSEKPGFVRPH